MYWKASCRDHPYSRQHLSRELVFSRPEHLLHFPDRHRACRHMVERFSVGRGRPPPPPPFSSSSLLLPPSESHYPTASRPPWNAPPGRGLRGESLSASSGAATALTGGWRRLWPDSPGRGGPRASLRGGLRSPERTARRWPVPFRLRRSPTGAPRSAFLR